MMLLEKFLNKTYGCGKESYQTVWIYSGLIDPKNKNKNLLAVYESKFIPSEIISRELLDKEVTRICLMPYGLAVSVAVYVEDKEEIKMPFCRYRISETCSKKDSPCFYNGTDCPDFEEKKETNADRIRAMNDEELAEFLCDFRSCDSDEHLCDNCTAKKYCQPGHIGMYDYLKKPAGEE